MRVSKTFYFHLASSEESGFTAKKRSYISTKILQSTKIAQGSNRRTSWIWDVNISSATGWSVLAAASCSKVSAAEANLHAGATQLC